MTIQKLYFERSEVFRVMRNTLVMSGLGYVNAGSGIFAIMFNEIKEGRFKKLCPRLPTTCQTYSWITVYGMRSCVFLRKRFKSMILKKAWL